MQRSLEHWEKQKAMGRRASQRFSMVQAAVPLGLTIAELGTPVSPFQP